MTPITIIDSRPIVSKYQNIESVLTKSTLKGDAASLGGPGDEHRPESLEIPQLPPHASCAEYLIEDRVPIFKSGSNRLRENPPSSFESLRTNEALSE